MTIEDPLHLLGRLRLGREEYCQRLLTMLILGGPYPRWNSRNSPSERGGRFLQELDALSFGAGGWGTQPIFVDEFDLPRRHDNEQGGAPDYAVLWNHRLWMIELKTEISSHRRGQLSGYFMLADHHYASNRIDLTYLTPPMPLTAPAALERMRFAHLTWAQVSALIVDVWGNGDDTERRTVEGLLAGLDSIGTDWPAWRATQLDHQLPGVEASVVTADNQTTADPFSEAMALAEATGRDTQQRVLNHSATTLEDLQQLRLSLREAICALPDGSPTRHVLPWLWNATTSGGTALTISGQDSGYELRLSRYRKPVC
ncbi:hypothetical protein ACFFHJ_16860 [Planotetraspora thailandica]|uniref:hypothetical protein n=1 Tax=Planotetraspora thailandica TaxID=487172 RepID=UPI00194E11C4|nr:hypothetical protein [Planotetraspora thailandica]